MKLSLCMFFPFIAILILSSCVQTSIPNQPPSATVLLHNLEIDSDGKARVNSKGKPLFTGNAVETFEQTPTKSISSWKQGKRHGISTTYFYNGNIRQTTTFANGLRQGPSKEYRISGELMVEEAYLQDNLHGAKIEFLPNGNKIMELNFDKGKLHGIATEWFPNGNQKSSTSYSNGIRSGKASEWYETGQKKLEQTFKNDLQNGERTIWYENGNKRLVATVKNGVLEGKANGWFSNGQQQFNYHFVNNLEHGDCSEWNNEGKLISKIKFSNGIPVTDLMTGQPYNSGQKDPVASDGQTDETSSQEIKDVEIDSSLEKENVDNGKENLPAKIQQNSDIQDVTASPSLEKPTEPKLETAKLPSESVQDKTKNDQNVETKLNDSSKPSDFDPFAKKTSPKNKVSEEATPSIPPLDVPPPAAPTFDPFKNDPLPQPADSTPQIPEDTTPSIPPLDVPPPPPAPTFNPFENDPLPALDQNLSNVTPKQDSNPFESVNSENNQSSVPLENIFNSPPESATEDNFNPFDLPADN